MGRTCRERTGHGGQRRAAIPARGPVHAPYDAHRTTVPILDRGPVPGHGSPEVRCTAVAGGGPSAKIHPMGMNPHHQHRRSNWDYLFVGAAIVAVVGVVAWAFLG